MFLHCRLSESAGAPLCNILLCDSEMRMGIVAEDSELSKHQQHRVAVTKGASGDEKSD